MNLRRGRRYFRFLASTVDEEACRILNASVVDGGTQLSLDELVDEYLDEVRLLLPALRVKHRLGPYTSIENLVADLLLIAVDRNLRIRWIEEDALATPNLGALPRDLA